MKRRAVEHPKISDLPKLRNRVQVFRDRASAGKVLADMLEEHRGSDALVMGIPAGGLAVAVVIARELNLALDVAVVSKITLPWNTEAGYGAVAFDGTVMLNEELLSRLNLSDQEIQNGIKKTEQKVSRRVTMFRGDRPLPDFKSPIILVDDGLASGFTLRVAIKALRRNGATNVILAVPTAHSDSVKRVLEEVGAIYCPNLRNGLSFAVADAYERWTDLDEQEVIRLLQQFKSGNQRPIPEEA
ncbi:MAG TPA: phosphoribosyltransferase family protein [Thermodesulfobacteriota bacterium]|nr:phosphoribosyltransferase family protein [Thermodesulfobacteriota bacterium]